MYTHIKHICTIITIIIIMVDASGSLSSRCPLSVCGCTLTSDMPSVIEKKHIIIICIMIMIVIIPIILLSIII